MTKAAILLLALGIVALAVPPHPFGGPPTWESLLAPYATGTPLPGGFRIDAIRRGADNGIAIDVRRAGGEPAVEVLVVERGRWKSDQESPSFTIDYELPRSPAPERDAITATLADTIRSHDPGLPAPDAIPLRPSDARALPWWIEMLRGVRGLLLGASLVAAAMIAIHRSRATCLAGAALGVASLATRLTGVPAWRVDLGGLWLLPAAFLVILPVFGSYRLRRRSETAALVILTTVALVLRLALGPWGPLHANGHGARFIAGASGSPEGIAAYGPGYAEFFRIATVLLPSSPDWALFAYNAACSALTPALAFALGRLTGVPPNVAFAAATLLAIDPIAIRSGATEAYFTPIALLCGGASVLVLLAVRALAAERRRLATAALVAAGMLGSFAARIHPCAWVLVAITPLVAAAAAAGTVRVRLLALATAAAVMGGVLLTTSGNVLLDVLGNMGSGSIYRPDPPSPWPLGLIALATLAYCAATRRTGLGLAAGVAAATMVAAHQAFAPSFIWEQAYFRLYLTLPLLALLAAIAPPLLRRRWAAKTATAVLVVTWVGFGLPLVAVRSTEQREYRWVREQIRGLPAECRLVFVEAANHRFLALPTYVPPPRETAAMDFDRPATITAALTPAPCLVYLRTSLCSTTEGRPACDEIERRLTLAPMATASFPVSGEFEAFSHDRNPVEVTLARVERVAP